jgi:hypothetical protein
MDELIGVWVDEEQNRGIEIELEVLNSLVVVGRITQLNNHVIMRE